MSGVGFENPTPRHSSYKLVAVYSLNLKKKLRCQLIFLQGVFAFTVTHK
jgi:hypothetical protein